MKRKHALLALALPALAALTLLFWSFGLPLLACMSEHSTSLKEYWGFVVFAHVCIFMSLAIIEDHRRSCQSAEPYVADAPRFTGMVGISGRNIELDNHYGCDMVLL